MNFQTSQYKLPLGRLWVIVLASFFVSQSVFAQLTGQAIGINPITELVCENKTTGQKLKFSNPTSTDWDCGTLGLAYLPGDIVKQTFKGIVTDPGYVGGLVTGLSNISKLKCQIKSPNKQKIKITPPSANWNCISSGLMSTFNDVVKQTIEGSVADIMIGPPSVPVNVIAIAGDGSATLNWDAVAGADYYNVVSVSNPPSTLLIYQAAVAPFIVSNLINGNVYSYYVTSVNASGESLPSATVSVVPMVDHSLLVGVACVSCHDGNTAMGKPVLHISSSTACENCHLTTAWLPAIFDHVSITGNCASCHDGVTAAGKNPSHLLTNQDCGVCHTTTIWFNVTLPVPFDHAGVVPGTCSVCHDGFLASGKLVTHLATSNSCGVCHSTTTWLNTIFPLDHNEVVGSCASCHLATQPASHPLTTSVCEACHSPPPAAWLNITIPFNHAETVGACSSCHNGAISVGKPANHIVTNQDCLSCHATTAWIPVLAI